MHEDWFGTPAVADSAHALLDAYGEYRDSLLRLYSRLRIADCYARDPQRLFGSLLVAELLGGVAIPTSVQPGFLATVIRPDGSSVGVACVSDTEGVASGGLVIDPENPFFDSFDWLALVAFTHARPVAVHLMPASAVPSIAASLCGTSYGHGLPATTFTHVNLMLEPVIAAAHGVVTFDLLGGAEQAL